MNGFSERYQDNIDHLKSVRLQLASALSDLSVLERRLALAKARAEKKIIDDVANGKPKALGSSADDRARALTIGIEEDEEFLVARRLHEKAQLVANQIKAEKESLEDKARLIALESDGYMRDSMRELATAITSAFSGRVAETIIGRENIKKVNGLA